MEVLLLGILLIVAAAIVIPIVLVARKRGATGTATAQPIRDDAPYNTLAIVAFILTFFAGVGGIICGHLALGDVRRRGERGRGLAIAALVIGYVQVAVYLIAGIVFAVLTVTSRN